MIRRRLADTSPPLLQMSDFHDIFGSAGFNIVAWAADGTGSALVMGTEIDSASVDLQIDANNDGTVDSADEPIKNDPAKPGKIIAVNDGDADSHGVPDYVYGYGLPGVPGDNVAMRNVGFTPVTLKLPKGFDYHNTTIKLGYDASDPLFGISRKRR